MPRFHATAACVLACGLGSPAGAGDFQEFSTEGLARSQGLVVRLSHPAGWRAVPVDDDMALAELRGPQGTLTGILQIGRGRQRDDLAAVCRPERARTLLQQAAADNEDTRVTDVVARPQHGRPAYEIRYERNNAPDFMVVRSVVVCLKDSQLVISCAGAGTPKSAVAGIEPVCGRVLGSVAISEE